MQHFANFGIIKDQNKLKKRLVDQSEIYRQPIADKPPRYLTERHVANVDDAVLSRGYINSGRKQSNVLSDRYAQESATMSPVVRKNDAVAPNPAYQARTPEAKALVRRKNVKMTGKRYGFPEDRFADSSMVRTPSVTTDQRKNLFDL